MAEAEAILTGGDSLRSRNIDELISEFGEHACFALQLFARICSQTERGPRASEAYRRALKLNPFLWHSFEELCNRGEKPDPVRTFQISTLDSFNMCTGNISHTIGNNVNGPYVNSVTCHSSNSNITNEIPAHTVYR